MGKLKKKACLSQRLEISVLRGRERVCVLNKIGFN